MPDHTPMFHGETPQPTPTDVVLVPLTRDEFFFMHMVFGQYEAVLKQDMARAYMVTCILRRTIVHQDYNQFEALIEKFNALARVASIGSDYTPVEGT